MYIPNPLRCFNCQKFGHGKSTCNRKAVCPRCGKEGHLETECHDTPHCANCAGEHPAFSKECTEWAKQKEITTTKFERNISFWEARQIVEQRTTTNAGTSGRRTGITYAQACREVSTATTQTELTWPLDSKLPILTTDITNTPITRNHSVQTLSTDASEEGAVRGSIASASSAGATNVPRPSATPHNSNKNNQRPGPASSKTANRQPKGSTDPISLYNRYGTLDRMELDPQPDLATRKGSPKHKV